VIEKVARRAAAALRNGAASVIVATPEHRAQIEARLTGLGIDTDNARADGRYVALDAVETLARFMIDGSPDEVLFNNVIGGIIDDATARSQGHRASVFGEMVALLCASDNTSAALQVERLWNDLATRHSFSLFCAYPLELFSRDFDGDMLLSVCAEHELSITADYSW
jgi:MEDS: MEthanogen/methylotroph, DcmR Sensory domain